MTEVLRLTEVRKVYGAGTPGEVAALQGASLSLAAGEVEEDAPALVEPAALYLDAAAWKAAGLMANWLGSLPTSLRDSSLP